MKKLAPHLFFLMFVLAFAQAQIVVDEGELVKLRLSATDADGDPITYNFSAPLNEKGEWQTTVDDAGVYNVEISASDGKDITKQNIIITVNNVNQAPDLSSINNVEVTEGEIADLRLPKTDKDGDLISYSISEPFGNDGIMETEFDDAGVHEIKIEADDGKLKSQKIITLRINDLDRAPKLDSTVFRIREGETFRYALEKTDPDGDPIKYTLRGFPKGAEIIGNEIVWKTNYDSLKDESSWFKKALFYIGASKPKTNFERIYNVEITANSNGRTATSTLTLILENVNRAPSINYPESVTFNEGEEIILEPKVNDADGDPVRVKYDGFMETSRKKTNYETAGIYDLKITASDGSLIVSKDISLRIANVNRMPFFNPNKTKVYESEESIIMLKAEDLDGQKVRIGEDSIPSGVDFNSRESTLTLTPSYSFVQHSKEDTRNAVVGALNRVFNVKNYEKEITAKMDLNDGEESVVRDYTITVKDVNRAPIMNRIDPITVREGERLYFPVNAIDPDGDPIVYRFTGLVRRNNATISYNKWGEYVETVIASDGSFDTSIEVPITVINVNRAPELKLNAIKISENETVEIKLNGKDPDGDNFTYSLINVPEGMLLVNDSLVWTPDFDFDDHNIDGKNKTIIYEIEVKDDIGDLFIANASIIIKDINRKPEILSFSPQQRFIANQGREIKFFISAVDPDGDELKYFWGDEKTEGGNTHTRQLLAPGKREFTVTVSDGMSETVHIWPFITRQVIKKT